MRVVSRQFRKSDTVVDLMVYCMAALIHIFSTIVFYFFFTHILLTNYFLLFIYRTRRDISISTLILYLLLILEARPTLAPLE